MYYKIVLVCLVNFFDEIRPGVNMGHAVARSMSVAFTFGALNTPSSNSE
jgi:hypothetical protein